MKRARGVTFVMVAGFACAAMLAGCAGAAGFPASKDTQLLGVTKVSVADCDSLFGKASDIANALKLAKPDGYTYWADKTETDPGNRPLRCVIADTPITYAVMLSVNQMKLSCVEGRLCSDVDNGIWVGMSYVKVTANNQESQTFPDPKATTAWLNQIVAHVK